MKEKPAEDTEKAQSIVKRTNRMVKAQNNKTKV